MDGNFFVACAVIGFGLFWITFYTGLLFLWGKSMAQKQKPRLTTNSSAALFGGIALVLALPIYVIDTINPVYRVFGFMCLWLMNGPPLFLGYWFHLDKMKIENRIKFEQNVESWVNQWELEHMPECMKELSDPNQEQ
jgi:hypothetical protein